MTQPGMMAIVNQLFGHRAEETKEAMEATAGQVINSAYIDEEIGEDGALVITFQNGAVLHIRDTARSCCESRYMTCEDDLTQFKGATLKDIIVEDGPTKETWGEPHEIQFLRVHTSNGVFTVETHNEHNGYYGGFWLVANLA